MPVRIKTFAGQPDLTQTVSLGGTQYRIRLHYRDRTRSWYIDVLDTAGVEIVTSRRVSPGWSTFYGLTLDAWKGGDIFAFGPEPYQQSDLGGSLQLWYYTQAELDAIVAAATPASTVTVLVAP